MVKKNLRLLFSVMLVFLLLFLPISSTFAENINYMNKISAQEYSVISEAKSIFA